MSVWAELKDRLLKFETLHGLYWIPTGIVGLYTIAFHIEFIIHVCAAWLCIFLIVEGLYKLLHNPIKKQAKIDSKRANYAAPAPAAPPAPPPAA